MSSRFEWLTLIRDVEREFDAIRQAADYFQQASADDPTILKEEVKQRYIIAASRNLEGTYVIRLFAAFESGTRQCWAAFRSTEPRMVDLLNALATKFRIPDEHLKNAHEVREYRNRLVHENDDDDFDPLAIAQARRSLCRFFSFLPLEW